MKFNKCLECSTEYVFKRVTCPNCHSQKLEQLEVVKGKAVDSVHLIATPSPFPDEYSIVLFETPGGARGFCRTLHELKSGDNISITEDEFGPVCSQS